MSRLPKVIQGAPDIALAGWALARAVAQAGGLGVISGTALPVAFARRLQLGDSGGHLCRALERFPFPGVARRAWERYYVPGGKDPERPFTLTRQPALGAGPAFVELAVVAAFAEVFLAREGGVAPVGMRCAGSARIPLLPSLYGAMLAGLDCVLVDDPPPELRVAIARLAGNQDDGISLPLADRAPEEWPRCGFDPDVLGQGALPDLRRPWLLGVVDAQPRSAEGSGVLAAGWDGVVLRRSVRAASPAQAGDGGAGETGSGTLAPGTPAGRPRPPALEGRAASLEPWKRLSLPCWLESAATPAALAEAVAWGATGVMATSPFLFCAESALDPRLKLQVLRRCREGGDALRSAWVPGAAGFPLEVVQWAGTLAEPGVAAGRQRLCDVGYLRRSYTRPDGAVGYRCPGEPVEHYVEKGGRAEEAQAQVCLCNAFLAGAGLAQVRSAQDVEKALIPAGEDLADLREFLPAEGEDYPAAEVVRRLLAQ